MKQSIIDQFKAVLNKYDKEYHDDGVMNNLEAWESNKSGLLNLLRKHPNWNEKELAIIYEVDEDHEVDKGAVYNARNRLLSFAMTLIDSESDYNALSYAINALCKNCTKSIELTRISDVVKEHTGLNCPVGQKTSRAINAVCKKYDLDKNENYAKYFATLADALNPLCIKAKAFLSIHPCDYLEMSNRDNNWHSCHCIDDGGWQAGTLSYMNDAVTMIFTTTTDETSATYHKARKRTRQVFAYDAGILLQSRLYPYTNDETARTNYRNIVQKTISDCLGLPNYWTLSKDQDDVRARVITEPTSLHYRDYEYGSYKPNVSLQKGIDIEASERIWIGHTAYCIKCGDDLTETNELNCNHCNHNEECCNVCGDWHRTEDMHEIDGYWYCDDCCYCCDECGEYCLENYEVTNRRGWTSAVCDECLSNYYLCENCNQYFALGRVTEIDGRYYCADCVDQEFTCCDHCDEYVRNDDIVNVDGGSYCESCAQENKEASEIA